MSTIRAAATSLCLCVCASHSWAGGPPSIVQIELVATDAPSIDEELPAPPVSEVAFGVRDVFFVEMWAQTTDVSGLSSITTDIHFDPALLQVMGVVHAPTFGDLTHAIIDNGSGLVEDLSGFHPPVDPPCADAPGAEPKWVRVAAVAFQAVGGGAAIVQSAPSDSMTFNVVLCGAGSAVDPGSIAYGGVSFANTCQASDTTCDNIDNDCNGSVDDGYEPDASCGIGFCRATNTPGSCVNGAETPCQPGDPLSADDATCDGVDDNCDGVADEGYVVTLTECGVGVCAATGDALCVDGGIVDTCTPSDPLGVDDATCDGVDDDCDGMVDEEYVDVVTGCGVGACAATGDALCVDGGIVDTCTPGDPLSVDDATCDGVDDDCDGMVDEDYVIVVTGCGVGACAATGDALCVDGGIVDTCSPGSPLSKDDVTCDGVDDNCNGAIDEDYVVVPTACGVGACAATGDALCIDGAVVDTCMPGSPQSPDDVTCDAVDDNCNGQVDEDYVDAPTACGAGVCAAVGAAVCIDGSVVDNCMPGAPLSKDDVTCDGIDDNCTGESDEDHVDTPTTCGVGACMASGVATCVDGAIVDSCVPAMPIGSDDPTCDNIDDDCDGAVDEDYMATPTACGVGVCAATGTTVCVRGRVVDTCMPGAPLGPDDTTCDGADDDCDGASDEDFAVVPTVCGVGGCAAVGQEECQGGTVVDTCTPGTPAEFETMCNDAVDNDCDGGIDCDDTECAAAPECNAVIVPPSLAIQEVAPILGEASFDDLDLPVTVRGAIDVVQPTPGNRAVNGTRRAARRYDVAQAVTTNNAALATWSRWLKPGPAVEISASRQATSTDDYVVDDGGAETSIQTMAPADMLWLTQHTATTGNEVITAISVAWGNVAVTRPAKVVVYSDPNQDGDPADAVRLVLVDVTIMNPNTSTIVKYAIPNTPVGVAGTSFFIGAYVQADALESPPAIDQTAPVAGRHWFAFSTPVPSGVGATLIESAGPGLAGNWMLRANAITSLCGNGTCDPGEPCDPSCSDCGITPTTEVPAITCSNGLDDDCDGLVDCADDDCFNIDPFCIPCTVTCSASALPEGEPNCEPDYADTFNGGCNAADGTPDYATNLVPNGAPVCGTAGNYSVDNAPCTTDADCVGSCDMGAGTCVGPQPFVDTDWYQFSIGAGQQRAVTLCVEAEFQVVVGLVDDDGGASCGSESFVVAQTGLPCSTVCTTACLDAGTYSAFVAPFPLTGAEDCASAYEATLTDDVCPPTSVCMGESDAACQLPDQAGHGLGGALTYAATSDADIGIGTVAHAAAGNFRPLDDGSITEVCWWGGYLGNNPLDCADLDSDDFSVTYYDDEGGRPGAVIAGPFTQSQGTLGLFDRTVTGESIGVSPVTIDEYSYSATHAAVNVQQDACYWLEVQNNSTRDGGCFWVWSTAPAGDHLSARVQLQNPVRPYDYRLGDERDYDLAYCVNIDTAADGCGQSGACCNDSTEVCTDDVAVGECLFVNGGRPGIDETCADLSLPCGGGGCCLADGSCINALPGDCAALEGYFRADSFCAPDGLLLCPQPATCMFDNGPGDPNPPTDNPTSQFAEDAYYAEAADNFNFGGDPDDDPCRITTITTWIQHFNAGPTGGGCDANAACTATPADYSGINVRIYDDSFAATGNTKTSIDACNKAVPQENFYVGGTRNCLVDGQCTLFNIDDVCVDNDGDGDMECTAECELEITDDSAPIVDLDVGMLLVHSWQGDVVVSLQHSTPGHPDLTVRLLHRPGHTIHPQAGRTDGYAARNFGNPFTDMELVLDDDWPAPPINIYDGMASGQENYVGPARSGGGADPQDVLSSFEGRPKEGTWRLFISDEFGVAGSGTIMRWSLRFNNVEGTPPGPSGSPLHVPEVVPCSTAAECVAAGCGSTATCNGANECMVGTALCSVLAPTGGHRPTVAHTCDLAAGDYSFQAYAPGGVVVPDAYVVELDLTSCNMLVDQDETLWLAIAPELPFDDFFQTAPMLSMNHDGLSAQRVFEPLGVFPWVLLDNGLSDLAFQIEGNKPGGCASVADCADTNEDGIRDSNCAWWECVGGPDGVCVGTSIVFADMGGQFGACPPDGTADGNDRFHALNCFADEDPSDDTPPTSYPCEATPPQAYNVDAGGPFGACTPDGVCDGNDAFHALNAFEGASTCTCPLDPAPGHPAESGGPLVVGSTTLHLEPVVQRARPGDLVDVRVILDAPVDDLRGYQLHLGVNGGARGDLELVDIVIENDSVFAGLDAWDAFNVATGQMVAGLDTPGTATGPAGYLATFTYRVGRSAQGRFAVHIMHDDNDPRDRTFLLGTPTNGKVAIKGSTPAVIEVRKQR